MRNPKDMLSPRDMETLGAQGGSNWIPKEPRELILPFMEEEEELDRESIDGRRKKAKQIYDDYGKTITECERLRATISNYCKDVTVKIQTNNVPVVDAIKRVFGTRGTEITFEMYKQVIEKLNQIAEDNTPTI